MLTNHYICTKEMAQLTYAVLVKHNIITPSKFDSLEPLKQMFVNNEIKFTETWLSQKNQFFEIINGVA